MESARKVMNDCFQLLRDTNVLADDLSDMALERIKPTTTGTGTGTGTREAPAPTITPATMASVAALVGILGVVLPHLLVHPREALCSVQWIVGRVALGAYCGSTAANAWWVLELPARVRGLLLGGWSLSSQRDATNTLLWQVTDLHRQAQSDTLRLAGAVVAEATAPALPGPAVAEATGAAIP